MALPPLPPKEYLDSDRLNYLVWRFLLESNYRETAAKLQKEWHVAAPHRHFSFAPHVKNQALVQVVQRGLSYYAFQRQFAQLQAQNAGVSDGVEHDAPQVGIFGPLDDRAGSRREDEHEDAEGEPDEGETDLDQELSRKRPVDRRSSQILHGSPAAKRPRLSNSYDNGADAASTSAAASGRPSPAPGAPPGPTVAMTAEVVMETAAEVAATANVMDVDDQPERCAPNGSSTGSVGYDDQHSHQQPEPQPEPQQQQQQQQQQHHHHHHQQHQQQQQQQHQQQQQEQHQQQQQNHSHHQHQPDLNHSYPSPLENDQLPLPIQPVHGHDKGTQLGKVEELATSTSFLQLTASGGPEAAPSSPLRSDGGDRMPVLLHCEWSPRDPSSLAAAGTDSFARIWTIARPAAMTPGSEHAVGHDREDVVSPQPPFFNIMPDSMPENSYVTALAWNGDGSSIAVATANDDDAAVSIWSSTGDCLQQLMVDEPPILKLRWNPNNVGLLAISPDDKGAAVTIFSPEGRLHHVLSNYNLQERVGLDAAWTSDSDFLLCGGDILLALRCTTNGVELLRKFEIENGDGFAQILYDAPSRLVATPTHGGNLVLWDDGGQRRNITAHSGMITAIQWQPLQGTASPDERLIATGGDDCVISIWNARRPDLPAKGHLTMKSSVLALAFTPDGAFLAGATANEVLIWKVGEYFLPRATWTRTPHPGWLSPGASGSTDEVEDEYCLCWDAHGQKLAYGANSRLAIIRFR